MRKDEMIFLGMQRREKRPEDQHNDPIREMQDNMRKRKTQQENNETTFDEAKKGLIEDIREVEGADIEENMKKNIREWI